MNTNEETGIEDLYSKLQRLLRVGDNATKKGKNNLTHAYYTSWM